MGGPIPENIVYNMLKASMWRFLKRQSRMHVIARASIELGRDLQPPLVDFRNFLEIMVLPEKFARILPRQINQGHLM